MLRETIRSVVDQTCEDFELIISDNASEDHTEEVVNSFADNRMRYVRNSTNVGAVKNFNECLRIARGRYVTIFHDDDIMLPDNLLLKTRALQENPTVGFVHSKFHRIDEQGTIVEYNSNFGEMQTCDSIERGHDFVVRAIRIGNVVNPPSVLMRKECYSKLGGFSDKVLFTTDFEYWMRIAVHYDVMFLASALIKYRMHREWGSSKYMMVVDGSRMLTLGGLEEDFKARRLSLKHFKSCGGNSGDIARSLRRRMGEKMINLVELQLSRQGDRRGARKAIVRMACKFPVIMREKGVRRLLVKCFLGPGATESVRRLALWRKRGKDKFRCS